MLHLRLERVFHQVWYETYAVPMVCSPRAAPACSNHFIFLPRPHTGTLRNEPVHGHGCCLLGRHLHHTASVAS